PTEGVGEGLFLTAFGLMFLLHAPAWRVEDPDSGAHLGIGAFNLIRAEAFRAVGGFGRLALSVDDDVRIGQVLKVAGYRTRVLLVHLTARQYGLGWYYGLTLPIGASLAVIALMRSTWLTLWRGGVRWRDHHYPLGELREHVRRRNTWTREVWRSTR